MAKKRSKTINIIKMRTSFNRTIIGLKFVLGCMTSPLKILFYLNYYRIEIELAPIGILERQGEAIFSWKGTCHQLKEISQDTLVAVSYTHLTLPTTPYV